MNRTSLADVERLAMQLPADQRRALAERRLGDLPGHPERAPRDLYGAWKGRLPEDFDLDAALRDVRSGWHAAGVE